MDTGVEHLARLVSIAYGIAKHSLLVEHIEGWLQFSARDMFEGLTLRAVRPLCVVRDIVPGVEQAQPLAHLARVSRVDSKHILVECVVLSIHPPEPGMLHMLRVESFAHFEKGVLVALEQQAADGVGRVHLQLELFDYRVDCLQLEESILFGQ